LAASPLAQPPADASKPEYPSGRFSGLMFGDYYWYYKYHQAQIDDSNPTEVEGQHGVWFRRIFFTYDYAHSEKISIRLRFEANSNGRFAGGNLTPYVRDAFLRWTYRSGHAITLGIHPTLTFEWLDQFWGLRHVEKTPPDLYAIDASRDFGFTFSGPARIHGLRYAAQWGNESGTGSETREGKILRLETRYERPLFAAEGFYSYARRPPGEDRHTAQGVGGFRYKSVRAAGQYLRQIRGTGDGAPDQTIDVRSAFVVWDVIQHKADLFFRIDNVKGERGGVETGLPGAGQIDYWLLSPNSKFRMFILGGEWFLDPAVRVGPNVEIVKYAKDPDPVRFPGRDQDAILRFTFFWTF
jgi:hypothetical protein